MGKNIMEENILGINSEMFTEPTILTPQCYAHRGVRIFELYCMIEYLGEIETEFQNVVACYQGPRWNRIMKK